MALVFVVDATRAALDDRSRRSFGIVDEELEPWRKTHRIVVECLFRRHEEEADVEAIPELEGVEVGTWRRALCAEHVLEDVLERLPMIRSDGDLHVFAECRLHVLSSSLSLFTIGANRSSAPRSAQELPRRRARAFFE